MLVLLGGLWLFYKKNWRQNLDTAHPEMQVTDPGLEYDFYVETSTNFIYEVKLFDSFAFVRPANPWFYTAIRRVDIKEFEEEFEQYLGDPDQMREIVNELGETLTIN